MLLTACTNNIELAEVAKKYQAHISVAPELEWNSIITPRHVDYGWDYKGGHEKTKNGVRFEDNNESAYEIFNYPFYGLFTLDKYLYFRFIVHGCTAGFPLFRLRHWQDNKDVNYDAKLDCANKKVMAMQGLKEKQMQLIQHEEDDVLEVVMQYKLVADTEPLKLLIYPALV